jgi:hypothetical protein
VVGVVALPVEEVLWEGSRNAEAEVWGIIQAWVEAVHRILVHLRAEVHQRPHLRILVALVRRRIDRLSRADSCIFDATLTWSLVARCLVGRFMKGT